MHSVEVAIPAGGVTLAGTLALPDGAETVVLMIHGSGPLDRDENIRAQKLNVFNTIAADLARRGIASLRYDKRGCGKSAGHYLSAGYHDVVDDAAACLAFLKAGSVATFRRFVLLGHSEGTIIAADIAGSRERVDGIVLLSPFLQRIEDILVAQAAEGDKAIVALRGFNGVAARLATRILGSPSVQQKRLIAKLKATSEPVIRYGLQKLPAKSFRELMALDPPAIYAKVGVPALVLSGGKDLQCAPEDGPKIAALIGPAAKALVLPDLTHILRNDPGEHTFLSYRALLKKPLEREVLAVVGDWLQREVSRQV